MLPACGFLTFVRVLFDSPCTRRPRPARSRGGPRLRIESSTRSTSRCRRPYDNILCDRFVAHFGSSSCLRPTRPDKCLATMLYEFSSWSSASAGVAYAPLCAAIYAMPSRSVGDQQGVRGTDCSDPPAVTTACLGAPLSGLSGTLCNCRCRLNFLTPQEASARQPPQKELISHELKPVSHVSIATA